MCILCKKTFITSIISQMLFYLLNLSWNDSDTKPLDSYSSDCFEPVKWSDSVKWQNDCFGAQRRNDNNDVTPTEGPEWTYSLARQLPRKYLSKSKQWNSVSVASPPGLVLVPNHTVSSNLSIMSDILEQVLMSLCAYFLVCPTGIEGSPERVTVHYVCVHRGRNV